MKSVFLLLLIFAARLTAATGDITSCTVRSDGWSADLVIEGFTTGATYDFDLDTNNVPTATTPYLTVVSQGYDDSGTLGTITRTVYLTKVVRKAYPDNATLDETGGGNLMVRIALSDHVYVDDNTGAGKSGTAPTVTLKSGFVVNTGGASQSSAAVTAGAVTNSSALSYPKVTANWSRPGYERVTGDFQLGAVAFEPHGQQGRPVRCVKFTATDTSANTATTIVTAPTYDATYGDAVPVVEYLPTMSVSSLTALQVLDCNFIAYPWVGDESSILDTSTGTAAPTPLFGPIKMLNDKSNTYGVTVAYVASGGSDAGAKTVYDIASYPGDATAYKFATIDGALLAIKNYNNANHSGRANVGGGIVYVNDGTYAWVGGSSAYTTAADTWVTVTRAASSTDRASVIIGSQSGNSAINGKTKILDMTLSATTNLFFRGDNSALWFDQCTINYTGASMIYANGIVTHYTRNTITAAVQGLSNPSGKTATVGLLRGNTISSNDAILLYTAIGNSRGGATAMTASPGFSTAANAYTDNKIIAFNKWLKMNTTGAFSIKETIERMAVVQNVFEHTGTTAGFIISLGADSSITGDISGVCLWHNTFIGERTNFFYNDNSTNAPLRTNLSVKNNITDDYNIKSDTFGTPSGVRVGNWSALHGVNFSGNLWGDYTNNVGAQGLTNEFSGLHTLSPAYGQVSSYMGYTSHAAWTGGSAATGNGDYSLTAASPAVGMQMDWVLPYDIAGTARGSTSAAGAYHFGTGNSNFFQFFQ